MRPVRPCSAFVTSLAGRFQVRRFLLVFGLRKLFSALNRLWEQQGFFEFNKHQAQQEGEVEFEGRASGLFRTFALTRHRRFSANRPACHWEAQLMMAPTGSSEPADIRNRISSARPQNRDSAMYCLGWIGQNFVKSVRSVTTSQNTFLCSSFRWHLDSVECGEIQHQRARMTSWRTGTKRRELALQDEPHCGHQEEKVGKHVPHTSAGPLYLSPGIAEWTAMRFWVSFGSGTDLQTSGVTPTPSEQQLSHTHCLAGMTKNSTN